MERWSGPIVFRYLIPGVLLLALGSGAVADPALLRYKASGPVSYILSTSLETSRSTRADASARPEELVTKSGEAMTQTVTAEPGGALAVQLTTVNRRVATNGHPVDTIAFQSGDHRYRITDRGAPADEASRDCLEALLSPELPEKPVDAGFAWEVTLPPSSELPYALPVRHEIQEFVTVDGERCAVIHTQATVAAKEKEPPVAIVIRIDGRLYLGVESGQVVRAYSTVECNARATHGFKSGGDTLKQLASRSLLRCGK